MEWLVQIAGLPRSLVSDCAADGYMLALAYIAAFATYHVAVALGAG